MTILKNTPAANGQDDFLGQTQDGQPSSWVRGESYAVFDSGQAVELFQGRKAGRGKPSILGVKDFDRITDGIKHAALRDDPYADWMLLRIKDQITVVEEDLQLHLTHFETLLREDRNAYTIPAARVRGRIKIKFHGPYSRRVMRLVQAYDDLRRVGFVVVKEELLDRKKLYGVWKVCENKVRSLMYVGLPWRNFQITRADVRQNTARAQEARAWMGDLPQDVLDGTWTAIEPFEKKDVPAQRAEELTQVRGKAQPTAPEDPVANGPTAAETLLPVDPAADVSFFATANARRTRPSSTGAGSSAAKRTPDHPG